MQVGQCGNQIGDRMGSEHMLEANDQLKGKAEQGDNQKRLDNIDAHYQETHDALCLVDLEPGIMDVIKASPMSPVFEPDNAGHNWAKSHYTEDAKLIDEVVDIIQRETES